MTPLQNQPYEHQQGRALSASVEFFHAVVDMKRFDDPILFQVLQGMRVVGSRELAEAAWQAIAATEWESESGASQSTAPSPFLDTLAFYEASTIGGRCLMRCKRKPDHKQELRKTFSLE